MEKLSLGQYIRTLREDQDVSLRELAKKIGCSPAFLSDVELGRRYPTDKMFSSIANALDTSVRKLKEHDTRPPLSDIRRISQSDPSYAFAFRQIIDQKVGSDELLKFVEGHKKSRKK